MTEKTFAATVDNIPAVTAFVDELLEREECALRAQMQIDVAIDEIFGNIAQYAYAPGQGEATVRFRMDPDTRMACLTFVDRGVPYDPLAKADPDVSLSAEERTLGGLGIFLVKKTMDDMRYERVDGENRLSLYKKI